MTSPAIVREALARRIAFTVDAETRYRGMENEPWIIEARARREADYMAGEYDCGPEYRAAYAALAALDATPGEGEWRRMSDPPSVGGHYAVGGWVQHKGMPRHFERVYARVVLTLDGPSWSHCDPAKSYVPLEYWFPLPAAPLSGSVVK